MYIFSTVSLHGLEGRSPGSTSRCECGGRDMVLSGLPRAVLHHLAMDDAPDAGVWLQVERGQHVQINRGRQSELGKAG